MRINTNIPSLISYNALTQTNNALSKSIQRLSTGLRINSAADDAAGLAISEKMRAQYRGLDQATSNAQDGISMIQTAEGALNETHSILQRMRELSVQAANDTLTQEDRSYIQLEIDELRDEVDRIATTTQFNKKQLLDGSAAVLWSSDNLKTQATVNGGLRTVDQFGQKSALEGNFKIQITAIPGQAEVKKSDIFKIKHENVVMNVGLNTENGFAAVRVDGLPAGEYKVEAGAASGANSAEATSGYLKNNEHADDATALDALFFDGGIDFTGVTVGSTEDENGDVIAENQSILFEVIKVDSASKTATFRVQVMGLTADGKTTVLSHENLVLSEENGLSAGMIEQLGWNVTGGATDFLKLATDSTQSTSTDQLSVGDKIVINYTLGAAADGATAEIAVSGTVNTDWGESWSEPGTTNVAGVTPEAAELSDAKYGINAANVVDNEIQFKQFYINSENGKHYEGATVITFSDKFPTSDLATGYTGTTFEAAFVGQVAKGDVALRDLDKFWDANGKFMLDDAKTLSIVQGDGTKTSVTLYSTDTLKDVATKLNDAIAYGLGQANYVRGAANKFVTFVEDASGTTESVPGTFVIRSLVPGSAGKINFSGDEDIIKAFSLNVIQQAKENQFRLSINDAHSGNSIAANQKITGNTAYGIIHENIDFTFDSMANIDVTWSEHLQNFVLKAAADTYYTTLHLADNTTVFQIGANEGEDMGINIGNMSARSLGINNILVTDRESAARSITMIDNAIGKVSTQRAKLGAYQNRLEHTINNLTTASTNMKSSESRIRDADMAKEMMEFTKLNILSQAGNSMLAQANQLPQNVLTLLR